MRLFFCYSLLTKTDYLAHKSIRTPDILGINLLIGRLSIFIVAEKRQNRRRDDEKMSVRCIC